MATIFIVDDDQAIGEMLSLVLENEGFQTVTCLDGLRAVEMFPICLLYTSDAADEL